MDENKEEKKIRVEKKTKWTRENPTIVGIYIFKYKGEFPLYIREIHIGIWQKAQNPLWLYAGETPMRETEGQWYGPIPEPKKATEQ